MNEFREIRNKIKNYLEKEKWFNNLKK